MRNEREVKRARGQEFAYKVELNEKNKKILDDRLAFLRNEEDKIRFEDYKANLIRYGFSEEEAEKQAGVRMKKEKRDVQKQALAAEFEARERKKLSQKEYDRVRDDFVRRRKNPGGLGEILSAEVAEADIHLKHVKCKEKYIAKHLDQELTAQSNTKEEVGGTEESSDG